MPSLADLLGTAQQATLTAEQQAHIDAMHRLQHEIERGDRAVYAGPYAALYCTCRPWRDGLKWPGDCLACATAATLLVSPPRECGG